MKILISGNAGYLGPVVLRHLRRTWPEATLVGLDMGYFAHCLTGAESLPERRADTQHFMDVRHLDGELLHGFDAIVHLAAISGDPMGNAFEEATYDVNLHGTVKLAMQAKSAGVKSFVFASSCSMYGLADDVPRTESSELNPQTAYAKSKYMAELELQKLADRTFTVTCLRFATACGMSERLRLDLVVNDFVACALSSGEISVLSDGTPWRPLIHVQDMARAIEWAICREPAHGDFVAVNTGSKAWNYRIRELAEAVVEIVPGVSISINSSAPVDSRSYRVDFSMYEKLAPNHQPRMDLWAAIKDLQNGLTAMGFRDPNFRNSGLMRLKTLRTLQDDGLLDTRLEWTDRQVSPKRTSPP